MRFAILPIPAFPGLSRERRVRLGFLPLAVAAPIVVAAVAAQARSNGIVGYSGAQKITCNSHHTAGVAPLVRFEGPLLVAADQLVTYRFIVESQAPEQNAAGLDVAVSGGELVAVEEHTAVRDGELTHTQPRGNDADGIAAWTFAWRAPREPDVYVFYGDGNSVDSFFDQGGDQAATTTLEVRVGCQADCNLDGAVSVTDVIRAVSIAQGTAAPEECPLADGDGDGTVSVAELVTAVRNALRGCLPEPAS